MIAESSINSVYVCKYVNIGEAFGKPFLVFDYAEEGDLRKLIGTNFNKNKFFSLNEIKKMLLQLSLGMKAINVNFIDRDVKPENILIFNDYLKINDLGNSINVSELGLKDLLEGKGPLQYRAPESFGSGKDSIKMDMYSMGIVFYVIVTLHYPYKVQEFITNSDFKNIHNNEPVIDIKEYRKDIPKNVVNVINRMLDKDPNNRFNNWQEIINEIK